MGWLRPEPQLIQAPNWQRDGAAHAEVAATRAELPVPARGSTVPCVRVTAAGAAAAAEATLDAGFEFCPQLSRLGYPLMLRREPAAPAPAPDADAADAAGWGGWSVTAAELAHKALLYRLMTAPGEGLSPLWEFGSSRDAPPPPVLAARADGLPLPAGEWEELASVYERRAPTAWQLVHVEAHRSEEACLTEQDFEAVLREWCEPRAWKPPPPTLEQRYPLGRRVEARELSRAELNGAVGVVAAHDEERGRVGVRFGDDDEAPPLALRPRNLLLLPPRPE